MMSAFGMTSNVGRPTRFDTFSVSKSVTRTSIREYTLVTKLQKKKFGERKKLVDLEIYALKQRVDTRLGALRRSSCRCYDQKQSHKKCPFGRDSSTLLVLYPEIFRSLVTSLRPQKATNALMLYTLYIWKSQFSGDFRLLAVIRRHCNVLNQNVV